MRALVAVVLSSLLGTCSFAPSVLEQIMSRGELRVVTRNSPGSVLLRRRRAARDRVRACPGFRPAPRGGLADLHGRPIRPSVSGPSSSGKADIGRQPRSRWPRRSKEAVTFGPAYQNVQQQVMYKRGTKQPRKVTDFARRPPRGRRGIRARRAARASSPGRADAHVDRKDAHVGAEELLRKVAAGDIDYTIADSHVFALLRHFYPDVRVAFNVGPANQVAWVLPKKAR